MAPARYDTIGLGYARIRREDPRLSARIGAALGQARTVVNVGAAMAVLTVHHWDDRQRRGVEELRRVARGPVVILTYDSKVSGDMWLMRDYLPEVAELDRRIFPPPADLAAAGRRGER